MTRTRHPSRITGVVFALSTLAVLAALASWAAAQADARPAPRQFAPSNAPGERAQSLDAWHTFAHADEVQAIAVQGDVIWAGAAYGGLVRWQPATRTYTQYLRPQDGLPGNDVRDLALDASGNLWVATDRGLGCRAPNGSWTIYTRESTGGRLNSNDVTAVAVAPGAVVWVGLAQFWDGHQWTGGGVARLDNDGWTAYRVQDGLASDQVTDIAVDGATGSVWVTMGQYRWLEQEPAPGVPHWVRDKGGISRFQGGTWVSFRRSDFDPTVFPKTDAVNAVALDSQGRAWFATSGRGLEVLDREGNWAEFTADAGLGGDWVLALSVDSEDHVWAATRSVAWTTGPGTGVSVLDHKGTIDVVSDDAWRYLTAGDGLPSNTVRALVAIRPDLAWLGVVDPEGDGYGLVEYAAGTVTTFSATEQGGLPSNAITAVAFDATGRAWVGTARRGVAVLDGDGWRRFTAESTAGGLATDLVRGIAVDGAGRVWVALDAQTFDFELRRYRDGGVSMWDGTRWQAYHLEDTYTVGDVVTELTANTPAGQSLVQVAFANQAEADAALASRYLKFDGDDTLYFYAHYVGQTNELSIAPPLARSMGAGTPVRAIQAGLADNRATSIGAGLDKVWIGTGSLLLHEGAGLSRFDAVENRWEEVVRYPSLTSDVVSSIALAGDKVWLATTNPALDWDLGGVTRGAAGGTQWTGFTSENSPGLVLCNNDARAIAADAEGSIWAGGFDGRGGVCNQVVWPMVDAAVNRFRDDTWTHWTFPDDGYVSALAVDKDGHVWLGTSRDGLTADDISPAAYERYAPGGGVRLLAGDDWLMFNSDNSGLAGDDIRSIGWSPNGERWFGTFERGLSVLAAGDPPLPPTTTPQSPTETPSPTPSITPSPTPTQPTITPTPTRTPFAHAYGLYIPFVALRPAAGVRTSGYRVSDSPGGPARDALPSGSQRLYGMLDYTAWDPVSVSIRAIDPNGNELAGQSQLVSGRGTAIFEISVATILEQDRQTVRLERPRVQRSLDEALQASETSSKIERGRSVTGACYSIAGMADVLAGMDGNAGRRARLEDAASSLREVVRLGLGLSSALSTEQIDDHLHRMRRLVDAGLDPLVEAMSSLGDGSSLTFPDSPAGKLYRAVFYVKGEITWTTDWSVGD